MNINIISCANSHCGIGRYTNELGNKISQSGNHVTVLRKDNPNPPVFQVYPHRSFRNLRHYIAPYYLSKAVKELPADIWMADYVDAASAFSYLKEKPEFLFTNVHDAIPFLFPTSNLDFWFYRAQLRFAARHSKKLIVVSEHSKRDLVNFAGIDPDQIEVIYNGINHQLFYPESKKENEIFTIRYVGGLSGAHKNAESLIKTAAMLEGKGVKFKMEIGGGHPENTILPKLVDKYRVNSVHFKGFIPDDQLRRFLSDADLFLYPSKYEGFGFPPLEAMACGTATVSSNAGSLNEILGDGAITVNPTPEELAQASERVIKNPSLKSSLEQSALKRASQFTWDNSALKHLQLFEGEFSKKASRRAS